jgi:integrase
MRRITFGTLTAEVLSVYEPPLRQYPTFAQMRQVLREFAVLPGLNHCSDIKPTVIAAWIKLHPQRSPVRTLSLLRTFRAACNYALSSGYLDRDPFSFRKVHDWVLCEVVESEKPRSPRHRKPDDLGRILAQADKEAAMGSWKAGRLQALVYVYAFTGMRKMEALRLRVHDVDLGRRTVSITARRNWRPKTAKSAAVLPLAIPLAEVLALWVPRCGGEFVFPGVTLKAPWTGGCPGYKPLDEIKQLGERAGVPGITILGFRKSIGTHAKTWGLGQLELKALLRHTSVETQKYYDEEAVESLRSAVDKIQLRITLTGT